MNRKPLFTGAGVGKASVVDHVPRPSWPTPFSPQQRMDPPPVKPQVWLPAAAIALNFSFVAGRTGAELLLVLPSPNWPNELSPQQ